MLAGGAGDLIARALAPKLTELWGQQVIVDNRPGSGGTLGMGIAARMPADGYNLMLGVSSFVVMAPGVSPKSPLRPSIFWRRVMMIRRVAALLPGFFAVSSPVARAANITLAQ